MTALVLLAASILPETSLQFARELQLVAAAITAFTIAVVGTVVPMIGVIRGWINGPTDRRIDTTNAQIEATNQTLAVVVEQLDEIKTVQMEDREHRQRLEVRQAEIGGVLGLHYNE